jgi:hypothetical protein
VRDPQPRAPPKPRLLPTRTRGVDLLDRFGHRGEMQKYGIRSADFRE